MQISNRGRRLRVLTLMLLLTSVTLALPVQKPKKSWWQRLLSIAGISATPSAQKSGVDDIATGDIWLVQVKSAESLRLTSDGGYRSPIFIAGDKKILALRGGDVVEIAPAGPGTKKLFGLKGVVKLVGLDRDNPNSVLMLVEDRNHNPALSLLNLKSRKVTKIPSEESPEFRRVLTHAEGWERVYGTTKVDVRTEVKKDMAGSLEWSDVYLTEGDNAPTNLSRCAGTNCGQPSLSRNGRSVTYVKAQE